MKKWIIRKPEMYRPMREATFSPGITATLLIVSFMFVVNYLVREIPASFLDFTYLATHPATNSIEAEQILNNYVNAPSTMLWSLLLTVILIGIVVLYVKRLEKRPLSTIGISRDRIVSRFAFGYLLGVLLLAVSFACSLFQAGASFKALQPVVLLFIPAFIVQASSEEILYRGYMLSAFTAKVGVIRAILISSMLFALMHIGSYGVSVLFLAELFFSGILFALLTVRTNNIWAACGAHAARNFAAGLTAPFVHGHIVTDYSILSFGPAASAGWGIVGTPELLPVIALDIVLITLVLFAGKNRVVAKPTKTEQVYFRAFDIAKAAMASCKDDFGKPYIRHSVAVADMLDGDIGRTAVMLADACNVGGLNPDVLSKFNEDVRLAAGALIRNDDTDLEYGMRIKTNATALEVWTAKTIFEEKLLIENTVWDRRTSKAFSRRPDIYPCPMLRRDIRQAECADIVRMVDGYTDDDAHAALRYLDRSRCKHCARHSSFSYAASQSEGSAE